MTKIADLLSRDLKRSIEEVIKLNQQDEQTVYDEIIEYVATQKIKDQFRDLLRQIAASRSRTWPGSSRTARMAPAPCSTAKTCWPRPVSSPSS